MRLVDSLIDRIRQQSDNIQSSSTSGVDDDEIVQFVNEALDEVMPVILEHDGNTLQVETEISLVANTEAYNLPANCYGERYVEYAEYSNTGLAQDYIPIDVDGLSMRDTSDSTYPCRIMVRNGQILVNPIPSVAGGKIRLQYQSRPRGVDIRRGTVGTVNSSGGYYTTIVLDNDSLLDSTELGLSSYLCFVDSLGVPTYSNFSVASYNSGTRTITAVSSAEATADGTIAVGNYVVLGQYTSTHLEDHLGRLGEQYVIAYAAMELLRMDSNSEYSAQAPKTARLQAQLVNALTKPVARRQRWPFSDAELLC